MTMNSVQVRGLTLAYRAAGDAAKPALLLLHGWPHSSAIYENVVRDLASEAYVLAFDLPEIGDSRGAPPSSEKIVLADLLLLAAETVGARSILIAGFDVGGMIAYAAARDHGSRIAGAVVANTVIPGIEPWSKVIADPRIWHFAFHNIAQLPETLVIGRERSYFDFFFDALAKNRHSLGDQLRDELTRAYRRPEALRAGFEWYRSFEDDATRNKEPKPIDVPLLYLRGDADARGIAEYVDGLRAAGATNLEGRVIENSGEYLPVEAPVAFCRALNEFRATLSTA